MSEFYATWELIRGRFDDAVRGLTHEQLNWRLHAEALTLAESAVHVAGVELWFVGQLLGHDPAEHAAIKAAATDGVVNDRPFPVSAETMTPEYVQEVLDLARSVAGPVIENPSAEVLAKEIKSALGPVITGYGAFARLAYHPGYHQGQAHLIKTAPGFPA